MNRRNAIKRSTVLLGGLVGSGSVMTLLNSCRTESSLGWTPVFLNEQQAKQVRAMVNVILPKGEGLPGGIEVGVPAYIDDTLAYCWEEEDQQEFVAALDAFGEQIKANQGQALADLDATKQIEVISRIARVPEDIDEEEFDLFHAIRGMALHGYFTSEEVGENVLKYVPVPSEQKGCVSLEEATGGVTYSL